MPLYGATSILIEDHGSGIPLVQEFKREGVSKIEGHRPVGDKQMRMAAQTNQVEGGYVYIPHEAPWLDEYLHELAMFPNAKYDDQVDSTSQGLDYLMPLHGNLAADRDGRSRRWAGGVAPGPRKR